MIITSLDVTPMMHSHQTGSDRAIIWVRLPPLTYEASLEILSSGEKADLSKDAKLLLSDCNGHPRSIECLFDVYKKYPIYDYTGLSALVLQGMDTQNVQIPNLEHVKVALRGRKVTLDTKVSENTIEEAGARGFFFNFQKFYDVDLESSRRPSEKEVIPMISPLSLIRFANAINRDNVTLATSIHQLLATTHQENWMAYEKFQYNWETVRRILFQGEKISIYEHYFKIPHSKYKYPTFTLSEKMVQPLEGHITQSNHQDYGSTKKVYVPARNPLFDYVYYEETDQGKSVIVVDLKHSKKKENTDTVLTMNWDLQYAKIVRIFGGMIILSLTSIIGSFKIQNIFYVCCSLQLIKTLPLHPNIFVLQRQHLLALYTPSLACRPLFFADVEGSKLDPTQVSSPSLMNYSIADWLKALVGLKQCYPKKNYEDLTEKKVFKSCNQNLEEIEEMVNELLNPEKIGLFMYQPHWQTSISGAEEFNKCVDICRELAKDTALLPSNTIEGKDLIEIDTLLTKKRKLRGEEGMKQKPSKKGSKRTKHETKEEEDE
jgi:hypothetical protein